MKKALRNDLDATRVVLVQPQAQTAPLTQLATVTPLPDPAHFLALIALSLQENQSDGKTGRVQKPDNSVRNLSYLYLPFYSMHPDCTIAGALSLAQV